MQAKHEVEKLSRGGSQIRKRAGAAESEKRRGKTYKPNIAGARQAEGSGRKKNIGHRGKQAKQGAQGKTNIEGNRERGTRDTQRVRRRKTAETPDWTE